MSDEIATYTFLPWLRQGIATLIKQRVGDRAEATIKIKLSGLKKDGNSKEEDITRDIQLYGPGDIIGIDRRAITKVEPQNNLTNFEPNYLPFIEFYDEDFPWRYSPEPNPANHRLEPWIALIVLKEDEFKDRKILPNSPLPSIGISNNATLPDPDQLWAWAHVHVNEDLLNEAGFKSDENDKISEKLGEIIDDNPDLANSRILCPRKLEENQAYHAFLVPVYESGRKAGLGETSNNNRDETDKAWAADGNTGKNLPYYYRWCFRTGSIGDFEYLVRLLEPKPVDKRVGVRDLDVQDPGANLVGFRDQDGAADDVKYNGVLKLEGALKIPDSSYDKPELEEVEKYRNWATLNKTASYPHPFQQNLAAFINLSDSYEINDAKTANADSQIKQQTLTSDYNITDNPDPMITAPLYGKWHALTQRLLKERDNKKNISPNDNWIHELNLDPRWRVTAGFGTKVVQENQETYMKSAWEQIGEVLEANKKIRQAQLAKAASEIWYNKHLKPLKEKRPGKWLCLTSPLQSRVVSDTYTTVYFQKKNSKLTLASTSVNMQKATRPMSKLIHRLPLAKSKNIFSRLFRPCGFEIIKPKVMNLDSLVQKINKGSATAAPKKETPEGIQTINKVIEAVKPAKMPAFIYKFLIWALEYKFLIWAFKIITVPIQVIILILFILIFVIEKLLKHIPVLIEKLVKYIQLHVNKKWPKYVLVFIEKLLKYILVFIEKLLKNKNIASFKDLCAFLKGFSLKWIKEFKALQSVIDEDQSPDSVDDLPTDQTWRINDIPGDTSSSTNDDNNESEKFKSALKDLNKLIQDSSKKAKPEELPELDIAEVNEAVYQNIQPGMTIPRWVFGGIILPPFVDIQQKERFTEAMAYPKFSIPMYEPLADCSAELFLPNINFVEQNSISLLETNRKFIEAYMVGLNHEFARELLWREYPTDQRGSYFRQFWEAHGPLNNKPLDKESINLRLNVILSERFVPELQALYDRINENEAEILPALLYEADLELSREELKDIKPLHIWSKKSSLGEHDNNVVPEEKEDKVVLVVRGELLKKFPNAVIYAHKADWKYKDGSINIDEARELAAYSDENIDSIIKFPLFEAKVEPDIYFFGFDLKACEAKGGPGKEGEKCPLGVTWDDPGWFFIIKERPGEPRFGLDISQGGNIDENGKIEIWNDLSWNDLSPSVENGGYIQINNSITIKNQKLQKGNLKENQQKEDEKIVWDENVSSADLAYILYQVPVMVAVHASKMLSQITNDNSN
ncbi:MAG: hypothetical protein IH598_17670 [Bacteroidales bacterium]|nr:hypothetical protein [Bacteroidales bacterium]